MNDYYNYSEFNNNHETDKLDKLAREINNHRGNKQNELINKVKNDFNIDKIKYESEINHILYKI